MSKNQKEVHAEYIKAKGKFLIACNDIIFSPPEKELLEKFGHWFEALTNGTLLPFNTKQEEFVEVAQMKRTPQNEYEMVWFKYLKRKEIEAKHGPALYSIPKAAEDSFYNRDMAKNLKRTMFKVMKDSHRK